MDESALGSVEQQLLDRVLSPGGPPTFADITSILRAAQSSYFALHRAADTDPVRSLGDEFPRLVGALSLDSQPVRREYVGRVRGKIDWGCTIRVRCSDDHNPQRFVCREADRITDTPENQLLVWVIERVSEAVAQVPDVMRLGTARHSVGGERFSSVEPQMDLLALGARRLLRHPLLRTVSRLPDVTDAHIEAAYRSRNPGYASAARLAERWQLVWRSPLDGLASLGRHCLLLPAPGADGRPWVDLAALLLSRD